MVLKWLFDRLVSLIGLLFLWPVLVVVSIMVRVKMPGRPATLKYRLEDEMLEQFCDKFQKVSYLRRFQTVTRVNYPTLAK